jgi:hypothetical protein
MLSYISFDETCLERSSALKSWLQSWIGAKAEFLELEDHDKKGGFLNDDDMMYTPNILSGTFIWSPPPAVANVAL